MKQFIKFQTDVRLKLWIQLAEVDFAVSDFTFAVILLLKNWFFHSMEGNDNLVVWLHLWSPTIDGHWLWWVGPSCRDRTDHQSPGSSYVTDSLSMTRHYFSYECCKNLFEFYSFGFVSSKWMWNLYCTPIVSNYLSAARLVSTQQCCVKVVSTIFYFEIGSQPSEGAKQNTHKNYLVLAHLFVKVPRAGDSEGIFSIFESSCHLFTSLTTNLVKCLAEDTTSELAGHLYTIPLMLNVKQGSCE